MTDKNQSNSDDTQPRGRLALLDTMMADHPWHPRVIPFLAYLLLLAITGFVSEKQPALYPLFYCFQCGAVMWLLWRYRKLLPELTLKIHWIGILTGIVVFVGWVWIGMAIEEREYLAQVGIAQFTSELVQWSVNPASASQEVASVFVHPDAAGDSVFNQMPDAMRWPALILRLLGMSLVVPLFEELFIRSLMLRSLNSAKKTGIGMLQLGQDMPVIGDWLMHSKAGQRADKHPPMFETQFKETPLGKLTIFGVVASTIVFAVNHVPRDWAGCVFCGIAYCLCLWATRKKGLGPVCWAHGITNALLWFYTMHTSDYRFL
jgi:membrane protease YdiL (CAAX protease family)